jgi:hypothetical protein
VKWIGLQQMVHHATFDFEKIKNPWPRQSPPLARTFNVYSKGDGLLNNLTMQYQWVEKETETGRVGLTFFCEPFGMEDAV